MVHCACVFTFLFIEYADIAQDVCHAVLIPEFFPDYQRLLVVFHSEREIALVRVYVADVAQVGCDAIFIPSSSKMVNDFW